MTTIIVGLIVFCFITVSAHGQDSKVIDAAKGEGGKVVVYSSMESSISDGIELLTTTLPPSPFAASITLESWQRGKVAK